MFTQFQGAFSDNALKQLVIFLVMAKQWPAEQVKGLTANAGLVFAVPFLLFSMLGGWLADRYSKRRVMIGVKAAEIAIMVFATLALTVHSIPLQLAAICAMGVHSAFFAASKYGSLPECVPAERLSWANGILEMLTFLAAILGTLAAQLLADYLGDATQMAGYFFIALALCGWVASLYITPIPAAAPSKPFRWNFFAEVWQECRYMRRDRDLWRANLGNTVFFFIAALLQANLVIFANTELKLNNQHTAGLNIALALGIGAGSLLAGKLSHGRVNYGLVPLGAWLLAAMCGVLGCTGLPLMLIYGCLFCTGVGGGLFIVPLAAVLQHRPSADRKGSVQGAASWLSWVGICAASGVVGFCGVTLGWRAPALFWLAGVVALVIGVYIHISRPGALRTVWRAE